MHNQCLIKSSYLEDIIPKIGYNPRGGRTQPGGQFKQQQEDLKLQGLSEETIQVVYNVIRANRIDYEVQLVPCRFIARNLTFCS